MDPRVIVGWLGKPCVPSSFAMSTPQAPDAEDFASFAKTEFLLPDFDDFKSLQQKLLDMEDGCNAHISNLSTCRCQWCKAQPSRQPWLDERASRVEVSMVLYNAQYGTWVARCCKSLSAQEVMQKFKYRYRCAVIFAGVEAVFAWDMRQLRNLYICFRQLLPKSWRKYLQTVAFDIFSCIAYEYSSWEADSYNFIWCFLGRWLALHAVGRVSGHRSHNTQLSFWLCASNTLRVLQLLECCGLGSNHLWSSGSALLLSHILLHRPGKWTLAWDGRQKSFSWSGRCQGSIRVLRPGVLCGCWADELRHFSWLSCNCALPAPYLHWKNAPPKCLTSLCVICPGIAIQNPSNVILKRVKSYMGYVTFAKTEPAYCSVVSGLLGWCVSFKSFQAQPRLAIVTATLKTAAPDFLHFMPLSASKGSNSW